MATPPRFTSNEYPQYPDDDSLKPVYLQADGLTTATPGGYRHVILLWTNTSSGPSQSSSPDIEVHQIIQLTGNPGNYNYYSPLAQKVPTESAVKNKQYLLMEQSTRAHRDHILELAKGVVYSKTSQVNSCRTWTKDLLIAMVGAGLIIQEVLDEIDTDVPLKDRVAEI